MQFTLSQTPTAPPPVSQRDLLRRASTTGPKNTLDNATDRDQSRPDHISTADMKDLKVVIEGQEALVLTERITGMCMRGTCMGWLVGVLLVRPRMYRVIMNDYKLDVEEVD